jgi:hypothetical protein
MSQLYMPFDSETGGLDEHSADLLTAYFAIMDEEYKILDEIYLKLKPDDRLPIAEAGALRVNGIDIQKHLADPETVTYSEGKKLLTTMIKKHLKKRGRYSNIMPFGYNVPFDERWCKKHLLPPDEWESMIHYKSVDVMKTVDDLKRFGWFPKELGSLSTVVEYLGIPKRAAHNAKEDTLMTIDVDKKLVEMMRAKKNGGGTTEQQDLISLLEAE